MVIIMVIIMAYISAHMHARATCLSKPVARNFYWGPGSFGQNVDLLAK